ncbi:MAG: hypothetical protein JXQ75_09055 [Phycisphaerae bacterium]|nr:hypothetical protein [Phycisphaerae bacterium]
MAGVITSADPLGEVARRGARLVLQKALEIEVAIFLGRELYGTASLRWESMPAS